MKTFALSLLTLWITFACRAQNVSFNQGGTTATHYYEEIPYEVVGTKMFIYVTIGGVRHKFLFDTGAPTQISSSLAAETGATDLSRTPIGDGTGKRDTLRIVSVKNIQLGQVTFQDIPAIGYLPDIFPCWDAEGAVGSNMLRNSIVQILPERHVIILTDDAGRLLLKKRNGIPLNTALDQQSSPFIQLIFKGTKRVFVYLGFDTGGDDFITMPGVLLNQIFPYKVCTIADRGIGSHLYSEFGLGKPDSTYRVLIPSLTLADVEFDNTTAEVLKVGMARIGARLLSYGSVTLDFIHHKFYFDPTRDKVDMTLPFWPVSPIIQNDQLFAGVVWGKMKDLIKPGEQIVAFGDVPTERTPLCAWLVHNPLDSVAGTVVVKIKGADGVVRDVSMTKE
ncbi:retropepsin-like aspartic protease [Dinghuibacter silviterrae]|uniref:Aspartyl protease n=1 Tax=Dinghuibacter silviterrae TaxID=1539049 RepID=A0A4V6QA04_9BACT|nr:retropepsin-like aspartic protease [Dinghuibacter silviterrae]TDX01553.1 aspartyl protease [Dinghuibacter silviterrae]